MSTVNDLVDAMVSGDVVNTETAFAAAMAEKLSVKLDAMRQEVAQNMFKPAIAEDYEETDLEENYLNKDGTGRSKEGYHDAGMFDKATADKHAKTHNGTVHQDASGKHLVKLPKPKQEETAE